MTGEASEGLKRQSISSANRTLLIAAAALLIMAIGGAALIVRFVDSEWQRELRTWQVRLGIVADSRFAAVDDWLDRQFEELAGLADNASLQLYMTQLATSASSPDDADVADAQAEYLQNLIAATATRAGFIDSSAAAAVPANLARTGTGGIALIDGKGQTVAATQGMPPLAGRLRDFLGGLKPGERGLLDMYLDTMGKPAMAFAIPVFAVQGNRDAASQIGTVVGVKEVADELFPLLHQPGETSETALAVLIRRNGAAIEYLSPLPDGKSPLSLHMAADTADLDAAFAIATPGGFKPLRHDYRSREVLVTSRAFDKAPWTLMYTIAHAEALGAAQERLQWLTAAAILAMTAVAVGLLAVWIYANSLRRAESAARYREMAERSEEQRNLLRLVTDSQPTGIFILDAEGRYHFANREAGRAAGIPAEDLIGKPIANIVGPEASRRYLSRNREVLETGAATSDVARLTVDGAVRVVQTDHIPVSPSQEMPKGVLVVEHDITEMVTERERRARILGQIVRTLVGVVDRRDPYAANHSHHVAVLARAIAQEMNLPERDIDTAETAGNLLNFGKILVAPELLTKSGDMSEGDRQLVRQSIQTSAELLGGIEFDGPVVMTLRQAQARWDGTGIPTGLAGEDILITARIVSVANAFVGMVSKRAYRDALNIDRAVASILDQVGKAFDRRVVVALINYLDNHGGRAQWAAGELAPAKTA
ncbi:MAG TPA: HD domain-containing phosphohydrolase [Candidatus Acidoferrum sp.]|nr:HD domain-containing phosphohydrolase [Candidatus Acidoferrum sp.]